MIFGKKSGPDPAVAQRDRIIAYKRVFGTPEGKTVLYDILDRCQLLSVKKLDDFQQGKRAVALEILVNMNINLTDFDNMMKGESK